MADDLPENTRPRFTPLFIIWLLCAVIPIAVGAVENLYIAQAGGYTQNYYPAVLYVLVDVIGFSCAIFGTATLVYTFVRHRFNRCWIYIVVSVALSLLEDFVLLPIFTNLMDKLNADVSVSSFSADLPAIPWDAVDLVSLLATILLVRFFTRKFKQEWKIVLFSLLSFFVLDLLTKSCNGVIGYMRNNMSSYGQLLPYLLKNLRPLITLIDVALTGVAYCVLAL
ncbi:MAG: hypothetical protein P4M02_06730, partial [Clostridia bacterium]|nr:hypothetical protein [Clostridia bacterium]